VTCHLIRFITGDRLELQGLYYPADGPALLHVHGLDGNFYENRFIDALAEACVRRNVALLTFNNRGHDYISDIIVESDTGPGYRQLGGMYETLGECVEDIRAAANRLSAHGHRKLILQGHSHGALKALHYLHATGDERVAALSLLSPSDDFALARSKLGGRFEEGRALAAGMVAEGRGAELMPPGWFDYPTSARTWHDLYRPDSVALSFNLARTDRDSFPELAAVRLPVFLALGTENEAFSLPATEFADRAGTALAAAPSFHAAVIEGAPHNYLDHEDELAAALGHWLDETREGPGG